MPLDVQLVRDHFPGREIHWFPTIASTMFEAVRLANAGAPHGTVVGAEEQTAGHGRYNRAWHSEKESGLYQTIILRFPIEPSQIPIITMALGLATAAAIEHTAAIKCDLRWPNDVMLNEKKTAGILVQLHGSAVVAGIGINVNQTAFPDDVTSIATSIAKETKRTQSREALLIRLLEEIETHGQIIVDQGIPAILSMFEQTSTYAKGRRVIIDETITGTTNGLTPEGFLKLITNEGKDHVVLAGGVRPLTGNWPLTTGH